MKKVTSCTIPKICDFYFCKANRNADPKRYTLRRDSDSCHLYDTHRKYPISITRISTLGHYNLTGHNTDEVTIITNNYCYYVNYYVPSTLYESYLPARTIPHQKTLKDQSTNQR